MADAQAQEWVTGHGTGSGPYFYNLADVTGDGRADAIASSTSTGEWWVAPSAFPFDRFETPFLWRTQPAPGAGSGNRQMVGDCDGDGLADSVTWFQATGRWWVALNDGNGGVIASQLWDTQHGIGSTDQFLADVDDDGDDDAVVSFAATGDWYVAKSNGTSFEPFSLWESSHGIGSQNRLMGDVTGVVGDDAVVFFAATGDWWVAGTQGTQFGVQVQWASGVGTQSSSQFLADVNGDGRDDAVYQYNAAGEWWVALSDGVRFGSPTLWCTGHSGPVRKMAQVSAQGAVDAITIDWNSGTWEVRVADSTSPRFATAGSATAFGSGCSGPSGTPTLQPTFQANQDLNSRGPSLGKTFTTSMSGLTGPITIGWIGFSDSNHLGNPLPLSGAGFGLGGCTFYTGPDITFVLLSNSWQVAIPNNPNFLGSQFYQQIMVVDPGANALGGTLSNAVECRIGDL